MTHMEVSFVMKSHMVVILGCQPPRYWMSPLNYVLIKTYSYLCSYNSLTAILGDMGAQQCDSQTQDNPTLPLFTWDHSPCCMISSPLPFLHQTGLQMTPISVTSLSVHITQPLLVLKATVTPLPLFLNALHRLRKWLSGERVS